MRSTSAPTNEKQRYFVVAAHSTVQHWWNRYLAPGYQHCYVLLWEGAVWLHIDPSMNRTTVVILELFDGFEHPDKWIEDRSATVIEVRPEPECNRFRVPWIFAPFTCVENVKALLGIRTFWCFTPKQLMQLLHRRNQRHESEKAKTIIRGKGTRSRAGAEPKPTGRRDQREKAQDTPRPNDKPRLHVVRSHEHRDTNGRR